MSQPSSLPATGTYVYCVTDAAPFREGNPSLATNGVGGHGRVVRTVEYGDLVVVVSDAPAAWVEINRENLLAHERVLEEVMARSAVLPFAFGTVAGHDGELVEDLLRTEYDGLQESLAYVRERVELDLRVLWEQERLFEEIVAEEPDVRALRDRVAGLPPDAAYYDRIQLGELTAAAIEFQSEQEAAAILEELQPLAVETVVNELLGEMVVLNAAFLVDKAREPDVDAVVQALADANAGRLIFRYVGPLPPYNFVDLRLGWEE